ncbi:hypothetical protein AURANDRAFT_63936 [Aureococcus anophagefferens]|uniref:Hexose transporter 1 n=1 Tax=Aureococcus anophagefferens TaxID=44056 RepID=F0Y8B3_AURAN|nr:hypothetical protein AURANDRAFT_63936 [Aureococcus anophagefferens]EGB08574.1 hypothetical protein AURANDRAFT_63936 [Aureococcus anophagefferens]|eukprot:XP_009036577.1 hypothetical protein AURANDRAFT_63936 [Aureococcus anophagefferens]
MASSAYDSLRQDSPRPGNRAPSTGEAGAADDAWQSVSRTFFFSVIAVMNQVTFGYDVGAVSQCLVPIQKTFHLTTLEVGAVTSALNYFAAGGALVVSGLLLDRIGRRGSLLVAAGLLILGGCVVGGAWSFEALVAGRFVQGLGVGASWASSGIYVTEIAPSHKRGALVSLVDSPRWLLARRRDDEARVAVRKLRRRGAPEATVSDAFDALRRQRDAHAAGDDVVEGTWAGAAASKEGKYAALLGVAQQATGTEAILYFAPTVLPKHNPFDAFLGNVGIGLAKFGGEVVASYLSDSPRLGRRAMMVGGNVGVTLGLLAFGVLVRGPPGHTAALIVALSLVMLSFSLGPGPFTTVFVNEVVPTRNRAKSSALSCFLNRITSACVALSFLPLSQAWGASAVFFSYAAVAAACTGLYAATLPDTLGKSLEQIGAQAGEAGLV